MKLKLLFIPVLFSCASAFAQIKDSLPDFNYDFWKDSTSLTELTEEEKKSAAVYLSDITKTTYKFGSLQNPETQRWVDNMFIEENLYYKRIRLNNDKAVEAFNKVYISNGNWRKVVNLKARAITADGKIIEFDDSNKKEVENYENYGPFTIFALEGIEVGSEIEYTYTTQEPASSQYYGITVQSQYPKRNYYFEIECPEYLEFKTKSYNGLKDAIADTATDDEVGRYAIQLDQVEAFKEEDYSAGDALKQRIEVKLFANNNTNKRNFYSWNEAATSKSNLIYSGRDDKQLKKEQKAIKKLVKSNKWHKITNPKDQVIAIEHYIKKNFNFNKTGLYYIHECIDNQVYSEQNATRIYALIFDYLGIDVQVVMTTNRYKKAFDEDFETYNYLQEYLLYFPKFDEFMAPGNDYMRLGMIPYQYAYQKGLFLKRVKLGGVQSAYPDIKEIPGLDYKETYDNLTADIEFDEDFEKINAHLKHESKGFDAVWIRPAMAYVSEEKKLEILESKLKAIDEDAVITNITTQNQEMKGYMLDKPYIYEGDVEVTTLVEKAGNKHLFKMGLVIGAQVEMYQDTARQYPVMNSYNHSYKRVLNIKIPAGYKITNLEDLNMNVSSQKDGDTTMAFTSEYTLKVDVLTVTCNEYYNEINVPLDRYEEFRKVINAAADFNKITLIFEPVE